MKRFLFPLDPKQTPSYVPLYVHLPRVYWARCWHLDEPEEDGYPRHAKLSKTNLKYFRLDAL